MIILGSDATDVWVKLLRLVVRTGYSIAPRGLATYEVPGVQIRVPMRFPVVRSRPRRLSYRFMAAEAHWILTWDDRVETIEPWCRKISDYSDDGVRFYGAYGPRIAGQVPYVIRSLLEDPSTRQAVLTIWRESPDPSKDIPCTVAIAFHIRHAELNLHVFMRSSDAWLGVPYDIFNFSMLGHYVTGLLRTEAGTDPNQPTPGTLFLTLASSHLYESNRRDARRCIDDHPSGQRAVPTAYAADPAVLIDRLRVLRDTKRGDPARWWER
jgi:thymidylate synthase